MRLAIVSNQRRESWAWSSHFILGLRGRHFQFIRLAPLQSVDYAGLRRWSKYHRKRTSGSKVMRPGILEAF